MANGQYCKSELPVAYIRLLNLKRTTASVVDSLIKEINDNNVTQTTPLVSAIVAVYFFHKRYEEGIKYGEKFLHNIELNEIITKSMIGMYGKLGRNNEILKYIRIMREKNIDPLPYYALIIKYISLTDIKLAENLCNDMKEYNSDKYACIKYLMNGYSSKGKVDDIIRIFNTVPINYRTEIMHSQLTHALSIHPGNEELISKLQQDKLKQILKQN